MFGLSLSDGGSDDDYIDRWRRRELDQFPSSLVSHSALIVTPLIRCLSIILLSALILTAPLAQEHDAAMGDMTGLSIHALDREDHGPHKSGPSATITSCEFYGSGHAGDCAVACCHPDLSPESLNASFNAAQAFHHPGLVPGWPGLRAAVETPPPKHLLWKPPTLFPQEIA